MYSYNLITLCHSRKGWGFPCNMLYVYVLVYKEIWGRGGGGGSQGGWRDKQMTFQGVNSFLTYRELVLCEHGTTV